MRPVLSRKAGSLSGILRVDTGASWAEFVGFFSPSSGRGWSRIHPTGSHSVPRGKETCHPQGGSGSPAGGSGQWAGSSPREGRSRLLRASDGPRAGATPRQGPRRRGGGPATVCPAAGPTAARRLSQRCPRRPPGPGASIAAASPGGACGRYSVCFSAATAAAGRRPSGVSPCCVTSGSPRSVPEARARPRPRRPAATGAPSVRSARRRPSRPSLCGRSTAFPAEGPRGGEARGEAAGAGPRGFRSVSEPTPPPSPPRTDSCRVRGA